MPKYLGSIANIVIYRQSSNTSRTLVGNKVVDNSDAVGASTVGVDPTISSFSILVLLFGEAYIRQYIVAQGYSHLLNLNHWGGCTNSFNLLYSGCPYIIWTQSISQSNLYWKGQVKFCDSVFTKVVPPLNWQLFVNFITEPNKDNQLYLLSLVVKSGINNLSPGKGTEPPYKQWNIKENHDLNSKLA